MNREPAGPRYQPPVYSAHGPQGMPVRPADPPHAAQPAVQGAAGTARQPYARQSRYGQPRPYPQQQPQGQPQRYAQPRRGFQAAQPYAQSYARQPRYAGPSGQRRPASYAPPRAAAPQAPYRGRAAYPPAQQPYMAGPMRAAAPYGPGAYAQAGVPGGRPMAVHRGSGGGKAAVLAVVVILVLPFLLMLAIAASQTNRMSSSAFSGAYASSSARPSASSTPYSSSQPSASSGSGADGQTASEAYEYVSGQYDAYAAKLGASSGNAGDVTYAALAQLGLPARSVSKQYAQGFLRSLGNVRDRLASPSLSAADAADYRSRADGIVSAFEAREPIPSASGSYSDDYGLGDMLDSIAAWDAREQQVAALSTDGMEPKRIAETLANAAGTEVRYVDSSSAASCKAKQSDGSDFKNLGDDNTAAFVCVLDTASSGVPLIYVMNSELASMQRYYAYDRASASADFGAVIRHEISHIAAYERCGTSTPSVTYGVNGERDWEGAANSYAYLFLGADKNAIYADSDFPQYNFNATTDGMAKNIHANVCAVD